LRALSLVRYPQLDVLPLPIDTERFLPLEQREARRSLRIGQDDLVLGFVGRLIPQKGLHYFLQVLDYCRRRVPRRLVGLVVGDFWPDYDVLNPLGPQYRAYIAGLLKARSLEGSVRFLSGDQTDERLRDCYGAIDLLIHPTTSIDENFGYVPLEALASERPVVATAYGGLKDSLGALPYQALASTWASEQGVRLDLPALTLNALEVITKWDLARQIAEAGAEIVAREFKFEVFERRLTQAVNSAVARCRGGGSVRPIGEHPPDLTAIASLEGGRSWSELRVPVSHYVSTIASPPNNDAYIFRWEGYWDRTRGAYAIEDAAWPAHMRIDESVGRVLARVPANGWWLPTPDARPLTDFQDLPPVHRLLRQGVLGWSVKAL